MYTAYENDLTIMRERMWSYANVRLPTMRQTKKNKKEEKNE